VTRPGAPPPAVPIGDPAVRAGHRPGFGKGTGSQRQYRKADSVRIHVRLTTLTATAALTALVGALPATAQTGGGANNLVQVVSTAPDQFAHRAGVQAAPYGGDSAQSTNLARADARDCTGCRSQAAALQAVFLTGDPDVVQVANAAVATNSNCTECHSYAFAYQYVVTTERAVSLTPAGHQALRDIQTDADAVTALQLDPAELKVRLDALFAELKDVVDNELSAGGHHASTRAYVDKQALTS
jgi:hypothetical protein